MKRKIWIILATVGIALLTASPVLATAPAYITDLKAIPSDTTMSLTWIPADGFPYTVIRYSTTTYPATQSSGTNVFTLAYSPSNNYSQSGLTAGTTYYYSAWGYDGANYSTPVAHLMMTTVASSGTSDVLPNPTISTPTAIPTTPLGWFNGLQPYSGFVLGFEQSWGMQTNEMPFTFGILILLVVGIGLYLKTHSPLVAIAGDFVVDFGLIALGLLSPYTIGVVLAFGLGVWALENIWI